MQDEGTTDGEAEDPPEDDVPSVRDEDIPDVNPDILRWNETLAEHVEPFTEQSGDGSKVNVTLEEIQMTVAQWYVRKDSKYYDVEEPAQSLSRDDVERVIIQRLKAEFPDNQLTYDEVLQLLQVLIKDIFVDPTKSIPVWSGLRLSMPGDPRRLTFQRMAAIINTWREPDYRRLSVQEAAWGPVKEFLEFLLPRANEREMIVNWLAWCLQNERDKPGWAPFLYSSTKGSGKSTFTRIASMLFGTKNSGTQNNIDKLVARFNAPVLEKKLVICEELQIPPNSDKANALKTYITERNTMSEHKYQPVQEVEQVCAFLFTTNHKPVWIETDDRRFYIVEIDHDGHRFGPRGEEFKKLALKSLDWLKDPKHLAQLYNTLMRRDIPEAFDASVLDVQHVSTDIMKSIQKSSPDLNITRLRELLDHREQVALSLEDLRELTEELGHVKLNAMKHYLADLGWETDHVKWGDKDYTRAIWLRQGYRIRRRTLKCTDGWSQDVGGVLTIESADERFRRSGLFTPTAGAEEDIESDDIAL